MSKKVLIHCAHEADIQGRIQLSNGVIHLLGEAGFTEEAFLPGMPWRNATKAEAAALSAPSAEGPFGSRVGVIALPMENVASLMDLVKDVRDKTEMIHIFDSQTPRYRDALLTMLDYLSYYYRETENIKLHHLCLHPPNLKNVTQQDDQYIGLHFDSWDQDPVQERGKARNRICVNLGKESRYLMFVPLTIEGLMAKMGKTELRNAYNVQEVLDDFFTAFPEQPVVKLEVKPGEAYVAPTENMIHDGCTLGTTNVDISFTMRGFFNYAIA